MRIVTFRRAGTAPEPGIVSGDRVVGLSGLGYDSVISVIAGWESARADIEAFVRDSPTEASAELANVTLIAPVPRPPKLICVGLNYRDHAIESKMELPKVPTIFNKFPNIVIGPNDPIVLPKNSEKPDYEA